ncbi:hypothetical protein [Pseudolactococcus raffinolactis]|uniref:hypothetical protein n=1 Tax=Pseudolactococcus raffinolactis TaxID=1366 RepID=UPI0011088CE9|nr:hypothetical protein [Lactococcus raffinolactis]MDG4961534.1 hypothetical protein [Lactococcus raffinolactis]TLQ14658.1 hypothetical protein FEZ46_05075 [Lactococcus raffinolactis]
MNKDFNNEKQVSQKYLNYREQVLRYTNQDMGLTLENDEQVYIAVFDMPIESGVVGFQTQTLALVFGLNTHIYHGSGSVVTNLEQFPEVMQAMQSLLVSSGQALPYMDLTNDIEFYNSKKVRVYLKTKRGIYFKELDSQNKVDVFLSNMMNHVMAKISDTGILKS